MRACWIDAGNDPDWVKLAAHKMTALYFPTSDPTADVARRLKETRSRGLAAGLYVASNWGPPHTSTDGITFAEIVSEYMRDVVPAAELKPSHPKVQFDIEQHDPEFILETLRRWRTLNSTQDTSWTMEPFQGGWMSAEFVAEIVKLKVRVVPQYYLGGMEPVAQDMALRELLRAGFPEAMVSGFYDAAALPARWDGFAFLQGRLP